MGRTRGVVSNHQAGVCRGLVKGCVAPRARLTLHLTTMFYSPNSEENSPASASDYDDESDNDNVGGRPGYNDNGESDNDDSDDAQSNAPYGENLRVRSIFSLEGLVSNSGLDV